jgi:phosphotransferase system HPr-like phosphotransfer protein
VSREAQQTIVVKHHCGWLQPRACVDIKRRMTRTGLDADIRVIKDGREFKLGPARKLSVLKLMSIPAEEGDELEVLAEGPDAEEALAVFETTVHRCALDMVELLQRSKEGGSA